MNVLEAVHECLTNEAESLQEQKRESGLDKKSLNLSSKPLLNALLRHRFD